MNRRLLLSILTIAALALAATATAASSVTLKSSGTVYAQHITVKGKAAIAGAIIDKKLGSGATVYSDLNAGTASTINTKFAAYFDKGSIKGTAVTKFTANADGTQTFSGGKLTVKSGTGAYAGAKGTGTIKGASDKDGNIKLTYTYSVKYKP